MGTWIGWESSRRWLQVVAWEGVHSAMEVCDAPYLASNLALRDGLFCRWLTTDSKESLGDSLPTMASQGHEDDAWPDSPSLMPTDTSSQLLSTMQPRVLIPPHARRVGN